MDHKEIIDNYFEDLHIAINKLDTLGEIEISQVVNDAYAKMSSHFDEYFMSKLSEDEIEELFESLDSETDKLIDSIIQAKKS